ncbi:hypothetical protein [Acetobacter oeni]|uniref:HPP family protein n=1 Tax=Acetobacter oeni TaxID=304077 RepID=A0A511XG46_9PROT|nr:hypothetical protein [Acetobacter oeni]MBB3882151.1 hypothetical protein [Acetobacter oeni]NHO17912.1 hypothetical protein [Acetobacter oeni]GBR01509.1 hypothetical protein AA21952_0447 [Acetobacter oeni LMG 21952]GEN61927.1 hypothetical protein AOE01nite_01510 [Acetobacter oeni]
MHMLVSCVGGIGLTAMIATIAPHYAPAALVVAVIYTIPGVSASWITLHETP